MGYFLLVNEHITMEKLKKMKAEQLSKICEELDIPSLGSKPVLRSRILAMQFVYFFLISFSKYKSRFFFLLICLLINLSSLFQKGKVLTIEILDQEKEEDFLVIKLFAVYPGVVIFRDKFYPMDMKFLYIHFQLAQNEHDLGQNGNGGS